MRARNRAGSLATAGLCVLGTATFVARSGAAREGGHLPAAPRQPADGLALPVSESLREFLSWAHPRGNDCGPPTGVRLLERWPQTLRVEYDIACGQDLRHLEAVLMTREGKGVWQVAEGFEAERGRLDLALRLEGLSRPQRAVAAGPAAGVPGIEPPPANEGARTTGTPMDAAVPPRAVRESRAAYPEEAGRARLLGEAHVELLVDISPAGVPLQARPLRGPDPDLGMRRAAIEAVLRWRFEPAMLAGKAMRYFSPLEITFEGLPPGMRDWVHRALFHVQAIVSTDAAAAGEARRRLEAGERFEEVSAALGAGATGGADGEESGDWGFVSAAGLPPAVRRALHEATVGGLTGPVEAGGRHYLLRKLGEVYYALHAVEGEEVSYRILHDRNGPEGEALRRAIEADIAGFTADSRRRTYVNEAARLMGIHQTRVPVGRLLIHTDALDENEIRMLGQIVEATIRAHEEFWRPIVPLRPFKEQVLVYAFAHRSDHDRLHALWLTGRPSPPEPRGGAAGQTREGAISWRPAGEYVPASRILAIPCEASGGHLPVPVLIHEAVHMLDFERVYGANATPSQWFEEGLAYYFGFSHVDSRLRIEPGEISRSGTIVAGGDRLQFDPRTRLHDYLRGLREGGPVPLLELLRAGTSDTLWSGERPARAYGAAWTLMHFLLDGDRGRRLPALRDYARLEARGEGGAAAFARLFGPDLAALESAWHQYEEGL